MSGQGTISEYFWVGCRPFDAPGGGALLSSVRREYFQSGKTSGGSVRAVESGREVRVRYRIGKGCFRWRKTSGRAVLQEAFPLAGGGYRLVSHDLFGKLSSASAFDGSLRWLQTAYYDGDPSRPSAVLLRSGSGISLLEYDPQTDKYVKRELVPCETEPGTAAQSYIDGRVGEPRVLAQTDAGVFCFCTEKEYAIRRSLRDELAKDAGSLTPGWPEETEGGQIDFRFIANDASALRAAASERAAAVSQNRPEADVPPVSGDYAADHEIFLSASSRKEERKSDGAAVSASTKYAVAAKGLSGGVIHAAALGKSDVSHAKPDSAALIPAKRIVVSSLESYQYFGKLLDGLREGQGRTQMLNGHTAYEGGYHNDKRDGFGVYYYKSGKICYVGGWRRSLRDGMGVAFGSRDGSIFVGHWENGVATGSGSAFDMAGNLIYTGGWRNGKRHGHGTEYHGGHIVRVGEWEDDRFRSGYSRVGEPTEAPAPPEGRGE